MKSGQYVYLNNYRYLFLGYIDYKRTRCLLADKHSNKCEVWVDKIN